jgi:alkylation response protein AidB-like acyl-CoA dehydrogenase
MTWVLDEQQRMMRDSARAFLAGRMPVSHLRALRDRQDALGYEPALWQAFAEQGYSAILVPQAHDGLGLGVSEAAIVAEEIGHTLAPTPFLSTGVLAAWLLRESGHAALQAQWLPRIAQAQAIVALAVDEGGRHRPDRLQASARRDGEGWLLEGHKSFVIDGHVADAWIVAARTATGSTVLLMVPRSAAGVTVERTVLIDAHNAARLRFASVHVAAGACLADDALGSGLLERTLDVGRIVVAAELLGVADEVFARTTDYLKQRRQFGRLIGEFQALQHRAAQMFCDLELTRAMVRSALQAIAVGSEDTPLRVAQAKARASLTANRVVQEGVQLHGGIGMTDELDIGLFMKRARVLQELFGDAAFQADRVALLSHY